MVISASVPNWTAGTATVSVCDNELLITPDEGFFTSGTPGGPFDPLSKLYTISNTSGVGSPDLSWVASASDPWITVVSGGVLAAGEVTNVVVSITAAANDLPLGTHTSTVVFSNLTSGVIEERQVQLQVHGYVYYVDAARPDDSGDGCSWSTAKKTIQGAVDLTSGGDTVWVTNGVYAAGGGVTPGYACSNRVVITNNIVLQSVNGPEVTFIVGSEAIGGGNGSNAVRGVYMSAGVLSGFSVTNGHTLISNSYIYDQSGGGINMYGGVATNCILIGNSAAGYGGGSAYGTLNGCTLIGNSADDGGGSYGGTLNNCMLTGNSATYGGGSALGMLNNCTLTGNSAGSYGGGSYEGTLNNCMLTGNLATRGGGSVFGTMNNCTLTGNSAGSYGGGSYGGTLNNCTLTGNSSSRYGGGSASGTLNNCIVYYNTAKYAGDNWYESSISYSCTIPAPEGTGNITNAPMLASASHISLASPCVGAGSSAYTSGVDIDGDVWKNPPSMGCDESVSPTTGTLQVEVTPSVTDVLVGDPVDFAANITGAAASNRWAFGDGTVLSNALYDVQHVWVSPGTYGVVLTAYNDDYPDGVSAVQTVRVYTEEEAAIFVSSSTGNDANDGRSWATAKQTIQAGVDTQFVLGGSVWVTNGIYAAGGGITPGYTCSNRVVITNNIVLRSVNGPEVTTIVGAEASGGGNGSGAVRGVYMSTGIISGFTVSNGHTMASGDDGYDQSGGGINMYGGDGVAANCILTGNLADDGGGGSYYGTLNNCTLTGNSATYGGGSRYGTLNNCMLIGNSAGYYGFGGGSYGGTLNNCTLIGNSTGYSGYGGGSYGGTLNNCTLTGNSALAGGGSYRCTLNNCIVYYNTAKYADDNWQDGSISYSCTTPAPEGPGNITNAPLLVSASHISSASPCVGAGSADYTSGVDIDGDVWQTPPSMGCDETVSPLTGPLEVSMSFSTVDVLVGDSVDFSAKITGEVASNRWTFGDGALLLNAVYEVQHVWNSPGTYDVVLTAYNDDYPDGVSAVRTVRVYTEEESAIYVSSSTGNDANDGRSWATAKQTIQAGVDTQFVLGGSVWVTNGIYAAGGGITPGYTCSNRVVITNNIVLRSVNGPEVTTIVGAEASGGGNGSDAVRGVYMSTGIISGFTVTNGHTMVGTDGFNSSGGGINGGGVVSNCILTGNSAAWAGGGSYGGTLDNCLLTGNSSIRYGGGSSDGTLNNCMLTGNLANDNGGGSFLSTLNNCTLTGNSSSRYGGGSASGTLNNCIIYYNTAKISGDNWYNDSIAYSCATPVPSGAGNIAGPPLFVDRARGITRLLAESPCVDAGNNANAPAGTDLAGNPRIINNAVDMGAYEFSPDDVFMVLSLKDIYREVSEGDATSNAVLQIRNTASVPMNYALSVDVAWVSFSVSSGVSTGGQDSVIIEFDTDGLEVGSYAGVITIVSADVINSIETVEVIVKVFDPAINGFEVGMGIWTNSAGQDFNWSRNSGATGSSGTGPIGAADGSYYLYTEASSPNNPWKSAAFEAIFDFSDIPSPKLEFSYHMYGAAMGTLSVDVYDGSWHNAVWGMSGQQQSTNSSAWKSATVDLSNYGNQNNVKIRFRGVTGSDYTSDMAVDSIVVSGSRMIVSDVDDDGIVDSWENEYFGHVTNCTASADADGDGRSNWQEYIAGTNPTNFSSCFGINAFRKDSSGFSMDWNAVSGRVYSVEYRDSLTAGSWQFLTNFSGIYGLISWSGTNINPACFYRINVEMEE